MCETRNESIGTALAPLGGLGGLLPHIDVAFTQVDVLRPAQLAYLIEP